ncbi:MAG: homocysteine S-methyltransferase family protein [Muribaculaceae bacterium]|nr:homocysteine S-methyltransferase family protein [Roseburia sp.]MCM1430551.1 homocysteine S-methyltransferase family protein [Muribaculaceae bacterium]MCM1492658.1 homocysteine S-methyltransferase family protein [Muribaculaceae bacterium]
MTKREFAELVKKGPLILDGATGTNLMEAGMPVGVCPEAWILENPGVFVRLQQDYVEAGSQIVYAPTFTANRIKLEEYALADKLEEMNRALVALSKSAVGERALVAGDMTMTGQQLFPLGELMFEELVAVYKEQARALVDAGVDLFAVETMMSLQESRAAVFAIREVCDLPIMVTLTYNEDGRTLFGTPPETAVTVLQSLGVDAIGINCSTGPAEMVEPVKKMAEYATVPIVAKPNAGLPELEGKKTVYRMTPEEFARAGAALVDAGASIVGGCCGTTKEHMRALAAAVSGKALHKPLKEHRRILSSERKNVEIALEGKFLIVGERINPTGKKKLQEELKEGKLDLVRQMAREQEEQGAAILDVNMGMNGIDEREMMERVICELAATVDCPLCVDSSYPEVIGAALRIYPGRALINSVSLEKEKIEKILPLAKKYGAMFVLLPLSDEGLPKDSAEKQRNIEAVYEKAMALGLTHADIVVDALVATIGANPEAAKECCETIDFCCSRRKLPTLCGLSNISFGLPERSYVNAAFLTMAISRGLTMAIANPSQELLMNAAFASDMLMHRPDSDIRYIERMNRLAEERAGYETVVIQKKAESSAPQAAGEAADGACSHPVFTAVLKGSKGSILGEVKRTLEAGVKPEEIIDNYLIAAINAVGQLFEEKKYFLPQLIGSANTMKLAIDYLEPMLAQKEGGEQLPTVVIATVEGDIHDIGKNLVALMLKNYGYHVIDLGKDVPAEVIVDAAMREQAAVIGLSALMTTTMMRMQEVVELCRQKGCTSKVIIGGACITQSFADEIGADGYSKDAAECVKLVERLLK